MPKRKTTEEFVKEAKALSKNEYLDFAEVVYINTNTKVNIICHKKGINGVEHGSFQYEQKKVEFVHELQHILWALGLDDDLKV